MIRRAVSAPTSSAIAHRDIAMAVRREIRIGGCRVFSVHSCGIA